ncbi:MAG TPA: NAD(P)H-dependent oxidoreductase subunit E, partial [Limnochordales bacterium]
MNVDGQSRAPLPGGLGFEAGRLEKAPPPLPGEQAALERVWGHLAAGERLGRRDLLLPALRALQEARGWISYPALAAVCRELGVPLAEAYGVASFYALLSTVPGPRHVVHLCDDVACMLRGARELAGVLERLLGPPLSAHGGGGNGDVAARRPGEEGDRAVGWAVSSCLGQCDRAPAALVGDVVLTGLRAGALEEAVRALAEGRGVPAGAGGEATVAWMGDGTPLLLRRCAGPGCVRLEEYLAGGGYGGLRRALAMGPAATLAEVERSR